jgi:DNA-binding response OmpR family regulator
VLIVDDEERFRATTAAILKNRGFEVTAVGTGLEAVDYLAANPVEVVILDLKMPEMDGNEALKRIKNLRPQAEVIMLTGHGTPDSALVSLRDGVFEYLTKPCNIDLLAQKIRDAYHRERGLPEEEPRVRDIMVPLSSFSTIREDRTVAEAIETILLSFSRTMATATVQETVHRSIIVLDKRSKVTGVMTFTDLLAGLQPSYMKLMSERPQSAADVFLEAPNYSGMFTVLVREIAQKTVRELMSDAPPTIDAKANLMEAANRLLTLGVRRLLVTDGDDMVGVVREQDLFFEMANVVRQYSQE